MEVCPGAGVDAGVTVEKLNMGVAIGCVAWGEPSARGVEACRVANRSASGVEAALKLHPAVKAKMSNVRINLV